MDFGTGQGNAWDDCRKEGTSFPPVSPMEEVAEKARANRSAHDDPDRPIDPFLGAFAPRFEMADEPLVDLPTGRSRELH